MRYPILNVAKLESSTEPDNGPKWFIVETYWTTDGPRTRLCEGRFHTEDDALMNLRRRVERN